MAGESFSIYEILRILVNGASPSVPGYDRPAMLRSIDAMEQFDLFGEREKMAQDVAAAETRELRERERVDHERSTHVRPMRPGF